LTTKPSVSAWLDAQPLGPPLWALYAALSLLVAFDGFDAQVIGFVAPAIVEDWGIRPVALAPVFAAGLFGMAIGALSVSPIADRIGRRPILVGAGAAFGICVLITSFVRSVDELLLMRFLTGFALGGVFPNALSLGAEFTPARLRTKAVMLLAGCFTLGAAIGGACATAIIPIAGWRSLFLIGGFAPLIISLLLPFWVPESIKFLALKGAKAKLAFGLNRIFPHAATPADERLEIDEPSRVSLPIAHLFREGRGWPTILIWTISFANLLELYFLSNWLPTLLKGAHVPIKTALLASTLLQVGGTIGTVLLAFMTGRFKLVWLLAINFTVAAAAIFVIGFSVAAPALLLLSVSIAGFCVGGGQPGNNAVNAAYYPTFIRASGVGWAQGIGRFGSIAGSVLGGVFLQMHLSLNTLFMIASAPSVITVLALIALSKTSSWQTAYGVERLATDRTGANIR
jgi:MFS transporter, AAHS family, 4-hydroxybenzoate transporter